MASSSRILHKTLVLVGYLLLIVATYQTAKGARARRYAHLRGCRHRCAPPLASLARQSARTLSLLGRRTRDRRRQCARRRRTEGLLRALLRPRRVWPDHPARAPAHPLPPLRGPAGRRTGCARLAVLPVQCATQPPCCPAPSPGPRRRRRPHGSTAPPVAALAPLPPTGGLQLAGDFHSIMMKQLPPCAAQSSASSLHPLPPAQSVRETEGAGAPRPVARPPGRPSARTGTPRRWTAGHLSQWWPTGGLCLTPSASEL